MPIMCSSCQSDNAQKLSMVYENGISSIDGHATTGGVGAGRGGLGVGVARSKVRGTQQTALSKKAAPPVKKRLIRNAIFYVIGILIVPALINTVFNINNHTLQAIVGLAYIAVGGYYLFTNYTYNKNVWPPLYQQWDRQYMCQKCGTIFSPAK